MPDKHDELAADLFYDIEHDAPMFDPRVRSYEVDDWRDESKKRIAAALRSVKAPPGCVIDTDGECNPVLGTLLLTRDKCIIGMGANVWVHMFGGDGPTCEAGVLEIIDNDDQHPDDYPEGGRYMLKLRNGDGREDVVPFGKVFGTREAALRAQADAPTKEAHGAD